MKSELFTAGANFWLNLLSYLILLSYSLLFFSRISRFASNHSSLVLLKSFISKNMFSFYTLLTTPLLVLNYMASAPYVQKQLSQIVIESIKPWNQACVSCFQRENHRNEQLHLIGLDLRRWRHKMQ